MLVKFQVIGKYVSNKWQFSANTTPNPIYGAFLQSFL